MSSVTTVMPGLTVFDSRKVAALMMRFVRGDGLDDVSVAGAMGNVIYGLYSAFYTYLVILLSCKHVKCRRHTGIHQTK